MKKKEYKKFYKLHKNDANVLSETDARILTAILEDDDKSLLAITDVIKEVWNDSTISNFIYLLLYANKELIEDIQQWDLENMKVEET